MFLLLSDLKVKSGFFNHKVKSGFLITLLTSRTSDPRPQQVNNSAFYLLWQSNSHSSKHLSGHWHNWPRGQHQLCYSCLRYTFADTSVYLSILAPERRTHISGPNDSSMAELISNCGLIKNYELWLDQYNRFILPNKRDTLNNDLITSTLCWSEPRRVAINPWPCSHHRRPHRLLGHSLVS